jgi:hypothetical protein
MTKMMVLKKSANIVSRTIGSEMVLLPIYKNTKEMNCIYTLNRPAARVWELIDGRRSVGAIKEKILTEFDVTPVDLEKRVRELLKDLKDIKAVN